MKPFLFHLPTEILFGRGRIKEFGVRLDPKFERILIVTDKNVALKSPAVDAVRFELRPRQVELYQDVVENPAFENIEDGARMARDLRAEIIIGVGGGSAMDAAKGIALLTANDKGLGAYLNGERPENPALPVVCVPTTSGSGSEVTPYAVFTDVKNRNKVGYANSSLFPIWSVVDPELTYTMPEPVIIHTGLDALTHALESFLSTQAFWMNDILALHVIDIVLWNLKQAVGRDPEAMTKLSYASTLAGINITLSGTILLHIMGYCLTTFHGLPHGRANAALLPRFLDFMRKRSKAINKVEKVDEQFKPFGGAREFVESFGVSTQLSSYGVIEEEIGEFVKRVIVKSDVQITPASVTEQDIFEIYRSAL